jgi:hypothetical protein
MERLPTAREVHEMMREGDPEYKIPDPYIFAIEFAKLHVEATLKAVNQVINESVIQNCNDHTPFWGECVSCGRYDNPTVYIKPDEELILTAYPLENIK